MELREYGCDMDGAMNRFLNDVELFNKCLDSVLADEAFEKLGQALEANQVRPAFEYAHTLKGVIGNMGLTPLYEIVVEIVEPLRVGNSEGMMEKYKDLMKELDKIKSLVYEGDK